MNTGFIESLLGQYEREARSGMIREKDKTAKEINRLLQNLLYEANLYEYIIVKSYAETRMAEANGRKVL